MHRICKDFEYCLLSNLNILVVWIEKCIFNIFVIFLFDFSIDNTHPSDYGSIQSIYVGI